MRENIMLCYPFEKKRFTKWGDRGFIQPKLNGLRCRAIVKEDEIKLLSSEGNEITVLPHIKNALIGMNEMVNEKESEFDGELYTHGLPFQTICSIVKRKVIHPDYSKVQYHIFDLINNRPQFERCNQLTIGLKEQEYIKPVKPYYVDDLEQVSFYGEKFLEQEYEGFILRKEDALYKRKRSTDIMKFKPTFWDTYKITGFKEQLTLNGTPKGCLGALQLMKGSDFFWVSAGLNDNERNDLWVKRYGLIGRFAKIKYGDLTDDKGVPKFVKDIIILDKSDES